MDFSNYFCVLGPIPEGFKGNPSSYVDLKAAGVAVIGYGQFITVAINFLILAFIIFMIIRLANRMLKRGEETPSGPTEAELLTEIRDELRKRP